MLGISNSILYVIIFLLISIIIFQFHYYKIKSKRERDIEKVVKKERNLLQTLIDIIPDNIYYKDRKSRFLMINKAQTGVLGLKSPIEAVGRDDFDFFEHAQEAFNEEQEMMQTGKPVINSIIEIKTVKGDRMDLMETKLPVYNENGKCTGLVGISRNITELMDLQKELIKAKEKAEESDKLKTAFFLNVSHEIRTPMNGILGFLNLLKQPELSDLEKSGFIDIVNKSGERLMNTINDIVEISKIETGDTNVVIEEINISEVMQYHFNFFKLEAEKKGLGLEIKNQIKVDESRIKTDKHKLDGILMNLIKNAVKFTSNGKIEFGNYIENDKLFFYVSDTGRGIPKDKINVIFERFVQAETDLNRNYEGSGIGLSIVKAHVEALNGEIEVDSTVGTGSTFRFYIPYNPVESEIIQQNNTDTTHKTSDKITILIAEDDEVNTDLMKNMLTNDFKLLFATNGEESIQMLQENPDISLILMDIKMPGKYDGLETTRKIRAFNKKIPIVAQTAYAQSSDKIKAIDAGCNDYISKPFNATDLKSIIRKYCK